MQSLIHHTRRMAALCAVVAGPLFVGGCNVRHELLSPQNPGVIDPSAVGSPSAAAALRVGALGSLKGATGSGENLWRWGGLLTDEYKSSDTFSQRNEVDQRTVQTNNGTYNGAYTGIQQARGFITTAIASLQTYLPTPASNIGELYMGLSFVEMQMAEDLCNGIPLGHTDNGVVTYTAPLTDADVLKVASASADTALSLSTATDASSVAIQRAALVTKARVLVDQGQFAAAAALVSVTAVPTSFQYNLTFSQTTVDNGIWNINASVARYTIGDSADVINGLPNVIKNALPFVSAGDPRVPVKSGNAFTPVVKPFDSNTPLFIQQIYQRDDPIPLVSGIDARLIEAEAKLNASDIAGMMTILNALRTSAQTIGIFKVPVMAALPTPATQAAAVTLFFREKAFWTFGRGQRLGDLRRLIRQYGRTQDNVFPTGVFHKGGNYGTDVMLPVTDTEKTNTLFTGCIDRNA